MECLFPLKCNNSEELSNSLISPSKAASKASDTIDVDYFKRSVEEHVAANRKPLFLLAHAGKMLLETVVACLIRLSELRYSSKELG